MKSEIDETLSSISTYVKNNGALLEVIDDIEKIKHAEQEGSTLKINLIIGRYGSKDSLEKERLSRLEALEASRKKVETRINSISKILTEEKFKCESCKGSGKISITKYNREDGVVTPIINFENCSQCSGLGYLPLSKEMKDYFKLTLNIFQNVNEYITACSQTVISKRVY